MSSERATVSIHEASAAEVGGLRELVLGVVESNPADPYLTSFRHALEESHSPEERFVEYAVVVDGELAARCEINFQTQSDDISGYGPAPAALFASEKMAALTGDLVVPSYQGRGLHASMIRHRLELLASLNFTYAVCGILVGNEASRRNYLRLGFAPIGEKDIDWGESAVGERIRRVVLYGFRLS